MPGGGAAAGAVLAGDTARTGLSLAGPANWRPLSVSVLSGSVAKAATPIGAADSSIQCLTITGSAAGTGLGASASNSIAVCTRASWPASTTMSSTCPRPSSALSATSIYSPGVRPANR